jgi:hypothetical protein
MLPNKSARLVVSFLALLPITAIGLTGCTPPTQPGATASASYTDEATATVTAINKAKRLITLKGQDGQVATVQATDAVRNFDQINVGDTVRINYQEQVSVLVRGRGATPLSGVVVKAAGARAAPGQKPAGLGVISATRSVEVVSVDRTSHTVTFRESDGTVDSFVVQNPQNYALADGLQPGTIVDVTETAGVALAVTKL